MAKRPAVRSQKLQTYRNAATSPPRTATSPPRRPAVGGRRKTTGAGGFAPVTSAMLGSGALSRGRGGVRKAAKASAWGDVGKWKAGTRASGSTARKPASAATRAKRAKAMQEYTRDVSAFKKSAAGSKSRLSARAKAETAARRPSGRNAETAARKKGFTARDRAAAKRMLDRGTRGPDLKTRIPKAGARKRPRPRTGNRAADIRRATVGAF